MPEEKPRPRGKSVPPVAPEELPAQKVEEAAHAPSSPGKVFVARSRPSAAAEVKGGGGETESQAATANPADDLAASGLVSLGTVVNLLKGGGILDVRTKSEGQKGLPSGCALRLPPIDEGALREMGRFFRVLIEDLALHMEPEVWDRDLRGFTRDHLRHYCRRIDPRLEGREDEALQRFLRLEAEDRHWLRAGDRYRPMSERAEAPTSGAPDPTAPRHSTDFRAVYARGEDWTFTVDQAAVVEVLWEEWENRTPEIGKGTLRVKANIDSARLQDVFKDHPAWQVLIVSGSTRGSYRLDL